MLHMNKTELIAEAAQKSGLARRDAERLINAALDTVASALSSGEKVQLSGFGVFEVRERNARTGRNPRTRETVEIPATRAPVFKPSKLLRDLVAK